MSLYKINLGHYIPILQVLLPTERQKCANFFFKC